MTDVVVAKGLRTGKAFIRAKVRELDYEFVKEYAV